VTRPVADIHVDRDLVRALLAEARPDLVGEPLTLVDEGWDNVIYRAGEHYAVRLPRRESAVPLIRHEHRWLPVLAPRLTVAVPVPVHAGTPSHRFPRPWSVVRWVAGTTAEGVSIGPRDAIRLADILRALHQPSPADAPVNPFRGVSLATRDEVFRQRLAQLGGRPGVNQRRLAAIWRDACAAPVERERRWLHGDLHPRNAIVRDGRVVGLVDWGDMNGGDVANDLACAWTMLDADAARRAFLEAYGASEAQVARARGWAALVGLACVEAGEPPYVPIGLATLARL
jgi:aminoglycoside phosphotransferase (APT) family kinase protein